MGYSAVKGGLDAISVAVRSLLRLVRANVWRLFLLPVYRPGLLIRNFGGTPRVSKTIAVAR